MSRLSLAHLGPPFRALAELAPTERSCTPLSPAPSSLKSHSCWHSVASPPPSSPPVRPPARPVILLLLLTDTGLGSAATSADCRGSSARAGTRPSPLQIHQLRGKLLARARASERAIGEEPVEYQSAQAGLEDRRRARGISVSRALIDRPAEKPLARE